MEGMCTKKEVSELLEEATKTLSDDIANLRRERRDDMRRVAHEEIQTAKEGFFKYVGIGGFIAVGSFVYFFGGLTGDVENLKDDMTDITKSMVALDDFMNRGDRFTVNNGDDLKNYSDQNDVLLQKQIDTNADSIRQGFEDIKAEIIRNR